jgi:hypothetical protein
VLLESGDRFELVLAAEVAKPVALVVQCILVPRLEIRVLAVGLAVSVPAEFLEVGVVVAALLALPRVPHDRVVELQGRLGAIVVSGDAKDEVGVTIVREEA